MKWLKSTTQKAWTVGIEGQQYTIPSIDPSDRFLCIDEVVFTKIEALPVVASLIKAGGITVLSQEPAELKNSVPVLQVTNTQLRAELDTAKARITQLEAQLKDATGVDIEAIKAEVRQQCEEEKKKALEDLDAKASQEIEARDKTIKKLETKIKKLGGESEE